MNSQDTEKLFSKLEEMGEETVRLKVAQGVFAPKRKVDLVLYWLTEREKSKQEPEREAKSGGKPVKDGAKDVWLEIENDYGVSKRAFAKKLIL